MCGCCCVAAGSQLVAEGSGHLLDAGGEGEQLHPAPAGRRRQGSRGCLDRDRVPPARLHLRLPQAAQPDIPPRRRPHLGWVAGSLPPHFNSSFRAKNQINNKNNKSYSHPAISPLFQPSPSTRIDLMVNIYGLQLYIPEKLTTLRLKGLALGFYLFSSTIRLAIGLTSSR